MDSTLFLSAVLPTTGKYCVATINPQPKGGPQVKHYFADTTEEVENLVNVLDIKGDSTYFALASYDEAGARKAVHARQMRCLFIDIDCGPGKAYATKKDGLAALVKFGNDTQIDKLGAPWIVDSGGGIHGYWPFSQDVTIEEWHVVAEAFKYCAKVHGFNIDFTVTSDAARVLRVPGTHNNKYTPARLVQLRHVGDVFQLDELAALLVVPGNVAPSTQRHTAAALAIPGVAPAKGPLSATAVALAANSETSFKIIMQRTAAGTGCAQLTDYSLKAAQDGMEPVWRAMLSLAKPCVDGLQAARKLSAMHPYPEDRMQLKLSEIKGPYSCVSIDSANPGVCGGCPHWGKITNPLALGRVVPAVTEPTEIEVPDEESGTTRVLRPVPPKGFFFGQHGGVFTRKTDIDATGKATSTDIMIVPYDLFMIDMLLEAGTYTSRFMALKGGKKIILSIPNKSAPNKEQTLASLAAQNIVASFGSNNSKNLYEYVHACIGEASAHENALIVPPRFGWQDDDTFALGDTIYHPGGDKHTFVSTRLSNLMDVTQPKGTLAGWVKIVEMLMQKEMWGHIVTMGLGAGSALMHFAPAGARTMSFHIASSVSGAGKSLALAMANSVWGDHLRYAIKPSTAERTLMQRAGLLGSLPLCIDEATNKIRADKEWGPNFIFDYSQGGHKIKGMGSANAEMRDDLHWTGMSLMTSNEPFMERMMSSRDTTSEGEVRRMLEWNGGSERLEWTLGEREVLRTLHHNYGVAGPVLVEWMMKNKDVAQAAMADALAQWRDYMHAPDDERFWTSGAAACLTVLTIFGPKYANIVAIPIRPCMEFLRKRVLEARRVINTNRTFAADLLDAYVRENNGNFIKLSSPDQTIALFTSGKEVRPDSTKNAVRGRVEYDINPGWTDLYIEVRMMKNYCASRNKSYIEFLKEIQAAASVSEVRKDLLAKTKGPQLRVLALKISRPNSVET